jgi:SAM-dependent methyltransferase
MGDTPRDPAVWKREQSLQWSDVAQGWQRRWVAFEQGAQPLSDRMMELAHVAPGHKVLDVAIDQATQMLEVARERMQAAGIETVEFVEGDAEAVTLPLDSFDAVVCRWGLAFFHHPVGTLARLRNSLIPGGWLAVAVWGEPSQVPIIALPFSVFSRELSQPPSPPSGPNPFALSEPSRLVQVLREAGFTSVKCEPLTVTFEFASVDDLLGHLGDVSAPIHMIMATLSPLDQAEFWKKLAAASARFADADGVIRLPNACLVAAGQRLGSA